NPLPCSDLFQWLWSKIVENACRSFVRYWNTHKTRTQNTKGLPSGVAPGTVLEYPERYGMKHAGTPVDLDYVQQLRQTLPKTRQECLSWVTPE
ncbi:hypothetical protein GGX14DRAFT_323170, partial [Mycena pura]